jgi:hypothetical protein
VKQNKRTHEQETVANEAANRSGKEGAEAVVLSTAPGAVNVAPAHHQHLMPHSKAKDGVSQNAAARQDMDASPVVDFRWPHPLATS